jgi:HEPN domain-containing protein
MSDQGDFMSDPNNPLDWTAYAEEDFNTAKILLKKSKPLTGPSCFHSQQCAEKYLKAMLIYKHVEFPKTQDLLALDTLCNNAGILTKLAQDDVDKLSSYAAHAYGPPDFEITAEDARKALEITKTVRRFARSFLGLKK